HRPDILRLEHFWPAIDPGLADNVLGWLPKIYAHSHGSIDQFIIECPLHQRPDSLDHIAEPYWAIALGKSLSQSSKVFRREVFDGSLAPKLSHDAFASCVVISPGPGRDLSRIDQVTFRGEKSIAKVTDREVFAGTAGSSPGQQTILLGQPKIQSL